MSTRLRFGPRPRKLTVVTPALPLFAPGLSPGIAAGRPRMTFSMSATCWRAISSAPTVRMGLLDWAPGTCARLPVTMTSSIEAPGVASCAAAANPRVKRPAAQAPRLRIFMASPSRGVDDECGHHCIEPGPGTFRRLRLWVVFPAQAAGAAYLLALVESVEEHGPGASRQRLRFPELPHAAAGKRRPRDAMPAGRGFAVGGPLAREPHRAAGEGAGKKQRAARGIDPGLVPAPVAAVVEVEASPRAAFRAVPRFHQRAAAENLLDVVRPGEFSALAHPPLADPEVELSRLGRTLSGRRIGRRGRDVHQHGRKQQQSAYASHEYLRRTAFASRRLASMQGCYADCALAGSSVSIGLQRLPTGFAPIL